VGPPGREATGEGPGKPLSHPSQNLRQIGELIKSRHGNAFDGDSMSPAGEFRKCLFSDLMLWNPVT
jgi:hypothetical protein